MIKLKEYRSQFFNEEDGEELQLLKMVEAPFIEMEVLLGHLESMVKKTDTILNKHRDAKVLVKPLLNNAKESCKQLLEVYRETDANSLFMAATLNRMTREMAVLSKENEMLKSQLDTCKTQERQPVKKNEREGRKLVSDALLDALSVRAEEMIRFNRTEDLLRMFAMLRQTFYRVPEMMDAVDELAKKIQPTPQTGMTVNNPQNCNFVEQQNIR